MGINNIRTSPYHAQTNGQVECTHQTIMQMIGKLSKDQKVDWPNHLLEMVQAYNSTRSDVTGYSRHYLMFGWWPKIPVDPTVRVAGGHKHVNDYITNLWHHMREACKEAQDQSMAEVQWQKWYYGRWIKVISLEPGNVILVKVYWYQGKKKKIRDWWEDMLYEVECQVTKDVPSYILQDEQGCSWILHCNQLLLIAPAEDGGIPLCVGVCTAWATYTSFSLDEPTLEGSENEESPKWGDCLMPTLHQVSKTPLGWINWKLLALPLTLARVFMQDQGWKVPSGGSRVWGSSMSAYDSRGTDVNP